LSDPAAPTRPRRRSLRGRGLRRQTAQGTIVNAAFLIAVNTLSVLRGLIVVAFLTPADYGVFGVIVVTTGLVLFLKQVGVSDRFVQQDAADQEAAFQHAFTMELISTAAATAVMAASIPVLVAVTGEPELWAPGFAVLATMPALALQAPLWIFYRRMDFVRQRTLQVADPLVAFAVTIGLAIAGAGYWALLIGAIAGSWAGAIVAVANSPVKLRWRYDREVARAYFDFSWPLVAAAGAGMFVAVSTVIVGQAELGLAGAGAITFASSITQYVDRVDQVVTQTMYPAICAVADRTELLFEAFVKSNRLALMWGAPLGFGLALFAHDLVHYVFGEKWRLAIVLLQVFGVIAALNHIAFNWGAFYRARGDTRPALVISLLLAASCALIVLPCLVVWGLPGLAGGTAAMVAITLAGRLYYVMKLFPDFHVLAYAWRSLLPTIPPALAVLALRAVGADGAWATIAEAALYAGGCALLIWRLERPLLREVGGYLRPPATA
jgi:O-antigen/teichoic acid export membrane protein